MHVDSKIDILFGEKDEIKFFNTFLSLSSEDIESISQEDFEELIEEKGYNLFALLSLMAHSMGYLA